ncbi:MAG: transcriptional repressor LexA [Nitrospirae bacterium]|nr:transcriptional repressor LexA [Nitrospirota bacterium]
MFRYILPKNETGDYILECAGWCGLVLRIPLTVNYRSPYNKAMTKDVRENRLKARIRDIADFYHKKGRMPSFSEIGDMVGIKSKNAVYKLVNKLEKLKVLERDDKGRLIPVSIASSVKMLGTVEAGFPSPAEEELSDSLSLDTLLVKNPQATFLLKVSGYSMSEAGILPGDMVIVDKGQVPKSGDIVIAEVDGEWTMKYLDKSGDGVTLLPANYKFKPIKPQKELKIAGVVTAVIRKYR